jgi:hypothetical protein
MLSAPDSPSLIPPSRVRRAAKAVAKPALCANSPTPLPRWVFASESRASAPTRTAPESESVHAKGFSSLHGADSGLARGAGLVVAYGAGLRAGAVLLALDGLVRAQPMWIGHFRSVQALAAANASARKLRLRADEAELRDALHLTKPGDDPGPAGRLYGAWNWLASRASHSAGSGFARLAEALGLAPADALTGEAFERRGADPIATAAQVAAMVVRGDDKSVNLAARETLAGMAADIALALHLSWPVPLPLFGAALGDPRLRAVLGDRLPHPGDADWEADAYVLVAHAAASAYAKTIEIDRRAETLVVAAAGLRTKGAEAGLSALLSQESVAPWALAKTMGSDRAARRFCDRLVELGALRARTQRATFRLYGL